VLSRVVRWLIPCVWLASAGCAHCPPADEEIVAQRTLDRVEAILAGRDPDATPDSGGAVGRTYLESLPYATIPHRGNPNARVRVLVISDFECPFCGRVIPELERLATTYPGDVVFYFVNYPLPFHRRARPAAIAALEAYEQGGDEAFFRMHDMLFQNQDHLLTDDLVRYAVDLGLDGLAMRRALAEREHEDTIDRDIGIANELGVDGTPTTFVGDEQIVGAQPFSVFQEATERALGR